MRRLAAALLLTGALAPAAADAAPRYASPAGMNETCSEQDPCSLETAIGKAADDDEVIVEPGEYTISSTIFSSAKGLAIHGPAGLPSAVVIWNGFGYGISIDGAGSVVSQLDIRGGANSSYPLQCVSASTIERVRFTAVGAGGPTGLFMDNGCLIRDSLIRADGQGAVGLVAAGLSGQAAQVRNLTVVATGEESTGVRATNFDPFTSGVYTLDLRNTIALGDSVDILADGNSEERSKVLAGNSDFEVVVAKPGSSVADAGGNTAAAPLFVDPATVDFHEAKGSPTIDAGLPGELGSLDLDGNPRVLGPAPDIGAYETAKPPPPPLPAAQIQLLEVRPRAFRAVNFGGSIVSRKKKVSSTVSYSLSSAGTVAFTIERKGQGRRAGKRCVKKTRANTRPKACALYKPLKNGFTHAGAAGFNSFGFSGRVGGRSLKPGSYRLVGAAGGATRRAPFTIVR